MWIYCIYQNNWYSNRKNVFSGRQGIIKVSAILSRWVLKWTKLNFRRENINWSVLLLLKKKKYIKHIYSFTKVKCNICTYMNMCFGKKGQRMEFLLTWHDTVINKKWKRIISHAFFSLYFSFLMMTASAAQQRHLH